MEKMNTTTAAMNTTATMNKTSEVLFNKCKKTQENLRKLMADAGCAGDEILRVNVPQAPGNRDDVVFVGLNGVGFYFLRGKISEMPVAVLEILKSCGEM